MISINVSELIWTIINFFLLLFLLNKFLFKPVTSFMADRQARIDAGLAEEEKAKAELAENDERLQDEIAKSREEAKKLLSDNAAELEKQNAERLQEARKRAVQDRKDAQAQLAEKQKQTADQLREAAPELAALVTERLLGEE